MPVCKNDPSKKYKGNEPSPKGFGYCAHAEKVFTIKEGTDNEKWIVIDDKNKTKKWIKLKIPKKFIDDINKNFPKKIKLKGDKDNYYIKLWETSNKKKITDEIKDKIIKKNKELNIKKISNSKSGLDIIVHHDSNWNVYSDDNLLKFIRKILNKSLKFNINIAEQGIQENKKAFFEILDIDWVKMYKKYR